MVYDDRHVDEPHADYTEPVYEQSAYENPVYEQRFDPEPVYEDGYGARSYGDAHAYRAPAVDDRAYDEPAYADEPVHVDEQYEAHTYPDDRYDTPPDEPDVAFAEARRR